MLTQNLNSTKGCPPDCLTGGKLTDHVKRRRSLRFEQLNVLQWRKQRLALGWLAGSFPQEKWCQVKDLLEKTFGTQFYRSGSGRHGFNESWSSPLSRGFFMCRNVEFNEDSEKFTPPQQKHGWAFFQLGAGIIENLVPRWFFSFLGELRGVGFRPTRIDISYDDYDRLIPVRSLWGFKELGMITRFRKGKPHLQHVEKKGTFWEGVTLGSRGDNGGGFYVRYYDKSIESKGKINAIRLEAEITGEKARAVWDELSNHLSEGWSDNLEQREAEFCRKLAGILGSVFDIVHKSKTGHLHRSPRLKTWQDFLDGLTDSLVRLTNHKRRSSLAQKIDAFRRQWAPMLAVFRAVMFGSTDGFQSFSELIAYILSDGESRWTDKHLAFVTTEDRESLVLNGSF